MRTYTAQFDYEDNARNTMGVQSYLFEALDICEAARITLAFKAALSRNSDWKEIEVKSIFLALAEEK